METGYLNFHDEEHFSDFTLSLGQHHLLDSSQSSFLEIEDDFDYAEARLDASHGLWGTEQELNGDMAILPVSGVATALPKIENMKEDFAKVLTDWQEHIGYLQASDMGEEIDMAELNMGIPERLSTDLPEDIFQNETSEVRVNAHSSPTKKRRRDFTNTRSPKSKTISESSSQEIDVIGLDSSDELDPMLDLIDYDHESDWSADIDYELLGMKLQPMGPVLQNILVAPKGKGQFDLASYIIDDEHNISDLLSTSIKSNESINLETESPLKKKSVKTEIKQELSDVEDPVDVETVVEQIPVLEAGDVKSLLEQFEASEGIIPPPGPQSRGIVTTVDSVKTVIDKPKQTPPAVNPAEIHDSKFHKNIRDSLPKEVIDRIKASARKKVISVIPALSGPKVVARSTRMQEAAATLSRTKLLKIVTNSSNSSSGRVDGSVQLDHDYCSSSGNSSSASSIVNSEYSESRNGSDVGMAGISVQSGKREGEKCKSKPAGYYVPVTKKREENARKSLIKQENVKRKAGERFSVDNGSKKDSGLESGEVSDASEETTNLPLTDDRNRNGSKDHEKPENGQKLVSLSSQTSNTSVSTNNEKLRKATANEPTPVYGMKIRSALATSILQLRKGVLTKTKSLETGPIHNKGKQMISVLKKPPNPSLVASNPNESIVTTKNSSNDEVQNIIVRHDTTETSGNERVISESNNTTTESNNGMTEAKKPPPRRKLNLAEYRSRREQTKSDNSRTCSPIQPMTLVYIHHASTSTEPCRDDPDNPVWSEREIVSVLKPKAEVEEEKGPARVPTREMAVQTGEETPDESHIAKVAAAETAKTTSRNNSSTNERTNSETRLTRMKDRKNRRYRRRRSSSSSSRSRSRSPVNRDRSRSRSRSKSRSRSRKCSTSSNPRRQRRISHRRSSVSSSSSWSSRSRSHTRSTSRSRSRSRSLRSRSRSRSSSRYSSCSRSSSRSNYGRSKWSGDRDKRRGRRRNGRRSCDRYRRGSSGSSHDYRSWRRSSRSSYRRQYDTWYHKEKKRQMEERRVIYVGRLDENTTKADLRRRFEIFGPVLDISVHFREHGDNYGFVTFAYKNDAYEAVEHGNDNPSLPRYDLSFGGRRAFCKVKYADLDGMAGNSLNNSLGSSRSLIKADGENTFDILLKEVKAKLRKRKV